MPLSPVEFSSYQQAEDFFLKESIADSIWVFSHKQPKDRHLCLLLQSQGVVPEDKLQSLYDFWLWIQNQVYPELRLISKEMALLHISSDLRCSHYQAKKCFEWIQNLAPLFRNEAYQESISEYVKNKTGHHELHQQSLEAFKKLRGKNFFVHQWNVAYFKAKDLEDFIFEKPLYLDVDPFLKSYEKEIFESLSHSNSITLIHKTPQQQDVTQLKLNEFAHQRLEVESCLKAITEKIEVGVSLKSIRVVAVDIEAYEDLFINLAPKYNLNFVKNKENRRPNGSYERHYLESLSELRLLSGVERAQLIGQDQGQYSFYEANPRWKEILNSKSLDTIIVQNDEVSISEFIRWIEDRGKKWIWSEVLLFELETHAPEKVKKTHLQWVEFLHETDFTHQSKMGQGSLQLKSLHDIQEIGETWVLGLNQGAFDLKNNFILNELELKSISENLGFNIESWSKSVHEELFSLKMNLVQNQSQVYLSFSRYNLGGEQNTLAYSLRKAAVELNKEDVNLELRAIGALKSEKQDLYLKPERPKRLSYSRINDFIQCPSIYAFKNYFRVYRASEGLYEVSPSEGGRFMHKLFEELLNSKKFFNNKTEAEEFVDQIEFDDGDVVLDDLSVSQIQKQKFSQYVYNLSQLEKERLGSERQFYKSEVSFQIYLNTEKRKFQLEGDSSCILLKGQVDRIDIVNKHALIIDYKTNLPQKGASISSWAKDKNFQLYIYYEAFKLGALEIDPLVNPFCGAVYMLPKENFKDQSGVRIKSENTWTDVRKSVSSLDQESFEAIIEEVSNEFWNTLENLLKGEFSPNPINFEMCDICYWRRLCRAPHLK